MKKIPETDTKFTETHISYNLLKEVREDAGAPVAKSKLLSKDFITIYGREAARKFYNPEYFKREGAMPKVVLKTLFGEDGVQTLDGKAHRHRKDIFMDLMSPERMEEYHKILDSKMKEKLDAQNGEFELFELVRGHYLKQFANGQVLI